MTDRPTQTSPFLPWKTRINIFLLSKFTDCARRQNGTINRRFISLLDFRAAANPKPIKGVKSSDVTIDSSRDLWFRLFVPTTTTISSDDEGNNVVRLPVMVFFHGGGFTFLRPDSKVYDLACRRFARKIPAVVVSVNYRLTPEHRYPCQYDDGFDILKFLDENRESLPENADVSKCFLAGDSAGANIAHNVAKRAAPATFGRVRVIGLIPIQPFFGGEERTEPEIRLPDAPIVSVSRSDWHWKVFLPEGSDRDHEAANVSGPRAVDISSVVNFPKTMVFVGGMDPLQEWQKRHYEWLKRSGKEVELKEYPSAIHGFYIFPELPESSMLFTEVKNFVRRTVVLLIHNP